MYIVKIGGGASINLEGIARGLAELDAPFVVVHGANALRDEMAARLGTADQSAHVGVRLQQRVLRPRGDRFDPDGLCGTAEQAAS